MTYNFFIYKIILTCSHQCFIQCEGGVPPEIGSVFQEFEIASPEIGSALPEFGIAPPEEKIWIKYCVRIEI
jgi:hypothetical protein